MFKKILEFDENKFILSNEEEKALILLDIIDSMDVSDNVGLYISEISPILLTYMNDIRIVHKLEQYSMDEVREQNSLEGLTDRQIYFTMVNMKTLNIKVDEDYFISKLSSIKRKKKLNMI